MAHKQLTREQRYHIFGLWRGGDTQIYIAKELGVHKSTISRELKNNSRWNGYSPEQAQYFSDHRRSKAKKHIQFTAEIRTFVQEKILLDWSHEQISGYAKRHQLFSISHEQIYQFILKNKENGGDLYLHLRHQYKKYRKRCGSPARQGLIKNLVSIDECPKIVDEKIRIGDWEIDTIIGKAQQQAIVIIFERVSKKLFVKSFQLKKQN